MLSHTSLRGSLEPWQSLERIIVKVLHAMADLAKTEVVMSDLAKTEVVMIDLAKPESGRLLFWERVGAFRPPSGAGFCTSERAECLCASYTIDAPALRFRRTSLVSFRSFE